MSPNWLLIPIALALLAIACGGDGFSPTPSPTATPTATPDAELSRISFRRGNELWSVNLDGSDPLLLSAEVLPGYSGGIWGNTSPRPSPQHDKVAFIGSDRNLMVVDSRGNNLQMLSEEAFPEDETYYQTAVFISGWSSDGARILYSVESRIGLGGEQQERTELLGFYVVDLDTGKKTQVSNLPNFVAWSMDPETVIYQGEGLTTVDWYTFNLRTGATSKLTAIPFECFIAAIRQKSLSSDGSKMLYYCGDTGPGANRSKIVIANIDNTDQRVLLEGTSVEFQFPVFSPNGEGFIYKHRLDQGTVIANLLFFDLETGQQTLVASGSGFVSLKLKGWVDDRSALILEAEKSAFGGPSTLYLVDVATGARTKLADNVTFE